MLRGRTIVVGVSGGIAAYKACELVRWFRKRDAAVIVVMTAAAKEFVTPLTFQALSGNPVVHDMWGDQAPPFQLPEAARAKLGGKVGHVDVAEIADAVVIAPATANLMARMVHGEAPDVLTAIALGCRAPLVVCPAMDLEMWRSEATQANVRALANRGAVIVPPESGFLASGLSGPGRLAEIDTIGAAVEAAVGRRTSLVGALVAVGAGRTEEAIDPVRVLTNRSSGRMGFALAAAARDRGAEVILVAGPASVDPPDGVTVARVTTAAEMQVAMTAAAAEADFVLMAAAVADYRPARSAQEKIKRDDRARTLQLEPNPDILAGLAAKRRPGQVLVGFALETSRGLARARAKLRDKGVDLIVLNTPADGIGGDTNRVTLVEAGAATKLPRLAKREVAEAVLDRAITLRSRSMGRKKAPVVPRRKDSQRAAESAPRPARGREPRAVSKSQPSVPAPRARRKAARAAKRATGSRS